MSTLERDAKNERKDNEPATTKSSAVSSSVSFNTNTIDNPSNDSTNERMDDNHTSATTTTLSNLGNGGSNPTHVNKRIMAKQHVQQAWRERRTRSQQSVPAQDPAAMPHTTTTTTTTSKNTSSTTRNRNTTSTAPPKFVPLCVTFQRTWDQFLKEWGHHGLYNNKKSASTATNKSVPKYVPSSQVAQNQNVKKHNVTQSTSSLSLNASSNTSSFSTTTPPPLPPFTASKPPRSSFPSVLHILQAKSLVQQVERFQERKQKSSTTAPSDSTTDQPNQDFLLSILPTGYDWDKAIGRMAQWRSRAFVLLDLALIIRTSVQWKQLSKSNTAGCPIVFCHNVSAANGTLEQQLILLRVLLQSNVALLTQKKTDLTLARQALQLVRASKGPTIHESRILDSATPSSKPDGYLRELVFPSTQSTLLPTEHEMVVEGPDEVHRIVQTLQRLVERRQQRTGNGTESMPMVKFLLRLRGSVDTWNGLVEETCQTIREVNMSIEGDSFTMSGISLDIGPHEQWATRQRVAKEMISVLEKHTNESASSSSNSNDVDKTILRRFRIDLTGFVEAFPVEWVDWWNTMSREPVVSKITIDCSRSLLPPASALCTRIIGRRQEMEKKVVNCDTSSERVQHLYIDDGCYGSLYQGLLDRNSTDGPGYRPLPLLPGKTTPISDNGTENSTNTVLSTVWGPTCDGLDRVCRDIRLPELHRDDWLVFPNIGSSSGMGTAFNGFNPPDTAYCVLDYFK